jgi:hypothetical protein
MFELRERMRLADQARACVAIAGMAGEDLQRDTAPQLLIETLVNVAHPPLSEEMLDADMPNPTPSEVHAFGPSVILSREDGEGTAADMRRA